MEAIKNTIVIKGIHPGLVLERELKKRGISKNSFAISINEYPQTLNAITKGKRRMNTVISLKTEKALEFEEGYFMILQTYYDIEQEKKKQNKELHPNLSVIRPILFWDTDFNKIDWIKNKSAVIKRIFERGNKQEINEIIRFYGEKDCFEILSASKNLLPTANENKKLYLNEKIAL